jgi:hypothetical protein
LTHFSTQHHKNKQVLDLLNSGGHDPHLPVCGIAAHAIQAAPSTRFCWRTDSRATWPATEIRRGNFFLALLLGSRKMK